METQILRRGIAACSAIESAIYSDSIVEVAIDVCNCDFYSTEHPIISIM
jgi:hypothetical protein